MHSSTPPLASKDLLDWGAVLPPLKGQLEQEVGGAQGKGGSALSFLKERMFLFHFPLSMWEGCSEALISHWSLFKRARALQCDPQSCNHNSGNSNQLYSLLRYLLNRSKALRISTELGTDRDCLTVLPGKSEWPTGKPGWTENNQRCHSVNCRHPGMTS